MNPKNFPQFSDIAAQAPEMAPALAELERRWARMDWLKAAARKFSQCDDYEAVFEALTQALIQFFGGVPKDGSLFEVRIPVLPIQDSGPKSSRQLRSHAPCETLPLIVRGDWVGEVVFFWDLDLSEQEWLSDLCTHAAMTWERIQSRYDGVAALAATLEARDEATGGHARRVAQLSLEIGRALGLSRLELERLRIAAWLHDLGKVAVSDEILLKPSGLSKTETNKMRQHPERGFEILRQIRGLDAIQDAIRFHHERWDGGGYPMGLKEAEIPRLARIIAVADAFDALVSHRPYRKGVSSTDALLELRRHRGSQFDPEVIDVFSSLRLELLHCDSGKGLLDFSSTPHGMV